MTMSGAPVVTVDKMSVRLDDALILDGIDLVAAAGEWVGVIGPNGAGKSTLLRAIVGLVDHTGSVGNGTAGLDRTRVAMMAQNPVIPPGMSVMEYVLLGRTAHLGWLQRESRHDRAVAAQVLADLGLARFAARPMTQLSGGEAQRVVLARAVAQEPSVLLLDEPTSALDIGFQHLVLELVDDLRATHGLTVIAAMHDLGTAARYADRLLLLDQGRAVCCGPPADVLTPTVLSEVYGTQLTVHDLDGDLIVTPHRRV